MLEQFVKNKLGEGFLNPFFLKKIWKETLSLLSKSSISFILIHPRRFFLSLLLFLILTNYLIPKNKIEGTKLAVARWPFSVQKHLRLIKVFFGNGNSVKTKEEIKLIQMSSFMSLNIKLIPGLQKEFKETETMIELPNKLEQQINQFEVILAEKPYYRDLYLRLSLLYLQTWQNEQAKNAWQIAYYLDPNNPQIKQLEKLIEELF